jgi:phosphoribosylanthranilate isomerase
MIIKVCGIKHQGNLDMISGEPINMVGLNFYPKSPRYIRTHIDVNNPSIKTVGVFVNETIENIQSITTVYNLDYIQLHGNEDVATCEATSKIKNVIKVFRLKTDFDWSQIEAFVPHVSYFLFDTHTVLYGGSGKKFDWTVLNKYTYEIPFLLSGGIMPDDASEILDLNHTKFAGIDINSGFELEAGVKDINKIKPFTKAIRDGSKLSDR